MKQYITAPPKMFFRIFKSVALVFIFMKILEVWASKPIRLNKLDKE